MSLLTRFGGGGTPFGSNWIPVVVSFNATATPIAVTPGTILWVPPSPGFVRGLTLNDTSVAPLAGLGGATTLSIGCESSATEFLVATAFASYATILQGWGISGPINSTNVGTSDSGVFVAPAGSVPGRAALARNIRGFANAGTVVGTLLFRFEFRPFAGAI